MIKVYPFFLFLLCLAFGNKAFGQIQNSWFQDSTLSFNHYFHSASPEGGFMALHHSNYHQRLIRLDEIHLSPNYYLPFYQETRINPPAFNDNIPEARSEIRFLAGYSEQQWVEVDHQQKMKDWTLVGQYYGNKSLGLLSNQGLNHQDLGLGVERKVRKLWRISARGRFAKWEDKVNGGLTNDTVSESIGRVQSNLFPVKLTSAEQKKQEFELRASVQRNFDPVYSQDSIPKLLRYKGEFFLDGFRSRKARTYSDLNPLSTYYSEVLLDSSITLDSISFVDQGIQYGLTYQVDTNISYTLYGKSGQHKTHSYIGESHKGYFRLGGSLRYNPDFARAWIKGEYTPTGSQSGDYSFQTIVAKPIHPSSEFFLEIKASRTSPNTLYSRYWSNHYFWQERVEPVKRQELKLGYRIQEIELSLFNIGEENALYLDSSTTWKVEKTRQIFGAELKGGHSLGKFDFHHYFLYRQSSRESLPLPSFTLREVVRYNMNLFPAQAPVQIGLDGYYFSAYYAQDYNPVLDRFVNQYETKYGGFIRLDAFLAMQVKTLRILLRLENAGYGVINNEVLYAPNSMLTPRNIRLGLVWRFLN